MLLKLKRQLHRHTVILLKHCCLTLQFLARIKGGAYKIKITVGGNLIALGSQGNVGNVVRFFSAFFPLYSFRNVFFMSMYVVYILCRNDFMLKSPLLTSLSIVKVNIILKIVHRISHFPVILLNPFRSRTKNCQEFVSLDFYLCDS
jgi:hypothetical protein